MSGVMQRVMDRAATNGIPISVQFDLTYRCNERCVHCYLDHDDHGELTTAEVKHVLDQLAGAGTLFLTFSGGELLLRKDFFELLAYARAHRFDVKIKTNALLIGEQEADEFAISASSGASEHLFAPGGGHDAITWFQVPERSVAAIRFLKRRPARPMLMRQNG